MKPANRKTRRYEGRDTKKIGRRWWALLAVYSKHGLVLSIIV
jgi:hypothetical protein